MVTETFYITPITKVYSSFAEAKEFFDKQGGVTYFETEKPLTIAALVQGKRNLVIGEPGVGKTLLLEKIKAHLDGQNVSTCLINLRQTDAAAQIDNFLNSATPFSKTLLLDALDEVRSSLFPTILQKIEQIAERYPDMPIFLSARWVFIARYATSFPKFRFVVVSPFTSKQVREYLLKSGFSEPDIETLHRTLSFSHRVLVIQIPRYLYYLADFWRQRGLTDAAQVSRNDLFEHFIYSKLELEETKLNIDKRAITKRVLEKLALTMEIYQTNVITKDDLMTFFDELKSDLKLTALSQLSLETFFEYSLLKNNVDTVEFDNTEFQEYLAAKEITRLSAPGRAAFAFAVEVNVHDIYPTWFNTLTFLVDMRPDLLEQVIEFSGLRGMGFKIVDEGFFTFFSRVDPGKIAADSKKKVFIDLVAYHSRTRQWLSAQLAFILPYFFDSSLEAQLRAWVEAAEKETEQNRYVPLANTASVIGALLRHRASLDHSLWRKKLVSWAADSNENGVLRRQALFALEALGDPSVIDELPDLMGAEELLERAFLSLCAALNPDNPKSFDHFVEAVRRDDFHGHEGLLNVKQRESIKKFLELLIQDETFRREFLEQSSMFKDRDVQLVERIQAAFDNEIIELCKQALIASTHYNTAHFAERSALIRGLWRALKTQSPKDFISEMVDRIRKTSEGHVGFYYTRKFFGEIIDLPDVEPFLDLMISLKEEHSAFGVMLEAKYSERKESEEIFEAGRSKLPEAYAHWKKERSKQVVTLEIQADNLLKEFRALLQPEPGKFSQNVFAFFNQHATELGSRLSSDDRARISELLTNTIFTINPLTHGLTITEESGGSKTYQTSNVIHIFGEAVITARHIGFDVSPYRQHILNYIPFAYSGELRAIFDLFKNIQQHEMTAILEVYTKRTSDLWRHQPTSLIDAAEQYHVTEAAPILKDFIEETKFDNHTRERALIVLDSLRPDPIYLKTIFDKYKDSNKPGDEALAHTTNGLLITTHFDRKAVEWRLAQIVQRVTPFVRPTGAHSVGAIEQEITFGGGSFARPLMELKSPDFMDDYLKLLDDAMQVLKKGEQFYDYATYMWRIVYAYGDNLKEGRSYLPLKKLETKIAAMQEQEGANWLAAQMATLRRSYLAYLGKPRTISEAVKRQNEAREFDDKKILNSGDLFRHLQDALDTDLRGWIEGEGAYDVITIPDTGAARNQYEKLIQKTLKTQIENIFLRRGFQVDVVREAQLLDEKRPDFLVRYGFAGPIIIEVKLTSNADMKGNKIASSASYKSMQRYMEGFGSGHGVFLIINNTDAKNLPTLTKIFETIPNVSVQIFDGFAKLPRPEKSVQPKRHVRKSRKIRS